ncbi:MAG TPA: right-handed parallel beta-helix repeat-containing protein [Pseudonocardia sp.]|nr:right-handed parallel beta-helix repeat-containing protein [Pseudonocardia sp.]
MTRVPGSTTVALRRALAALVLPVLLLAGVTALAGCGIPRIVVTAPPPKPMPPQRPVKPPTDCTRTPATEADLWQLIATVEPGDRVCLLRHVSPDSILSLTRSGTADKPIVLESDGTRIAGLEIDASNVVVQGFNISRGTGIEAQGDNIILRDNDVRDAFDDGIRCDPCTNSRIIGNRVVRADGVGIGYSGSGGTIRANDVSESVHQGATAPEGIEFSGTDLTIDHNYAHDIGDPAPPTGALPSANCFDTEDSATQLTYSITLTDNVCANVSGRCLAADGSGRAGATIPSGVTAVRFERNFCQNASDGAVQLVAYPGVTISQNTFAGPFVAAVYATKGSSGVTVTGNTLLGQFEPGWADDTSPQFSHSGNLVK